MIESPIQFKMAMIFKTIAHYMNLKKLFDIA